MRGTLTFAAAVAAAGVFAASASAVSGGGARTRQAGPAGVPAIRIAGLQHFCGTNGVNCSDPALTWDEYAGFQHAVSQGAPLLPYIGHDEPEVQFFSNRPGTGNNVTYFLKI